MHHNPGLQLATMIYAYKNIGFKYSVHKIWLQQGIQLLLELPQYPSPQKSCPKVHFKILLLQSEKNVSL